MPVGLGRRMEIRVNGHMDFQGDSAARKIAEPATAPTCQFGGFSTSASQRGTVEIACFRVHAPGALKRKHAMQ